jgi:hypothetical protein
MPFPAFNRPRPIREAKGAIMASRAENTATRRLPATSNADIRNTRRLDLYRSIRCAAAAMAAALPLLSASPARSANPSAERRLPAGLAPAITANLAPQQVAKPLLAAWSFDETSGTDCRDISGNGNNAIVDPHSPSSVRRVPGLFGKALSFSQNHAVRLEGDLHLEAVQKISFSAWVVPTELSNYREIFRKEDGDDRVLFSFQDDGAHLSLGLNVGGYVECDASIDPIQVLDGAWHHCAATFDGKSMRVYFDGKEIGALERPGRIQARGRAPGFIGSCNGGECFQGLMDDLRIYRDALTAEEVRSIWRTGWEAYERSQRELLPRVNAIYVPARTFAETLAECRKNMLEKGGETDPKLAAMVAGRLRAAFPDDYANYVHWTGADPSRYLIAADNAAIAQTAQRLLELALEYRPLTEGQWNRLKPADRRQWQEAAAIGKKFEQLMASGQAMRYSPGWIEVILEAGPRIQERPRIHEAVAPYVKPSTSATRALSAVEGRQAIERDWLHQAEANPTPQRIQDEVRWTRWLCQRINAARTHPVNFAMELLHLADLEKRAAALRVADQGLYFQVRAVKRAILLKNPVVDFNRLLLVDMPYPQGSEWPHETRHRLGYMAVPGGKLVILNGLAPDSPVRQLMPQPPLHGSFWRPELSYDGEKVVFCYKPHNEKAFHLYEIGIDGTGLKQLTDGIYDDFDPIYLPDGHILFSTTRGHTYVRCMPPTNAFSLARCDADGKNVYLVSYNNEPDYLPSVMNDGRVIYTRWEYTDKPLWRAEKLWTMNPDGTQVSTFWGNQSVWPDLVKDARSIPNSRRVMMTGSAHHNWFAGSVGIIDPDRGLNFPDGLTKVTADTPWPESGNGPVDPIESPRYHASGRYEAYYSPYPLSEQDFLVSANRGGKFVLYLMDVDGNRELIYESDNNVFHALPIRPRAVPPLVADRVAWPTHADRDHPQDGLLYSNNVYDGAPTELAGKAKYLRVLHIDEKTYTYWYKRPYISTGPVVSAVQSEGVKRILGTVPIEQDGSVAFRAPAGQALHFQLLDENFRALQTMRSFAGVMPGEVRGCFGCHESHSRAPATAPRSIALSRPASKITPPPWGVDTVSYPRYVQPVLDKYCGKCHQGSGDARKVVDLTDRPGDLGFSEVYWHLIGRPSWGAPYQKPAAPPPGFGMANMIMVEGYGTIDPAAYKTPQPMTHLSYKSPLIDIASNGKHYDVKVDPISLQRLIAWVDAMCPYMGDEEIRQMDDPVFQGVDWLSIRPRIKTAPRIVRPGPVD